MRVVLIHGIGGPREAERELTLWLEALCLGLRASGHSQLTVPMRSGHLGQFCFVDYSRLFLRDGEQGDSSEQVPSEVLDLLLAVVDQRLELEVDEATRDDLLHCRAELAPRGQAEGVGNVARRILNGATTLLGIPPLRRGGQWISAQLLVRDLAQVSRYLNRVEANEFGVTLDARIRDLLIEAIDAEPAIVIAHSLGTIVAAEALHDIPNAVPLLVTLGSPIALRTVVLPRLRPSPPRSPENVKRWLNFWDRDDVIAARPLLENDVAPNSRGVGPDSRRVDSDGVWVHSAVKYLAHANVAGPIAEALEGSRTR